MRYNSQVIHAGVMELVDVVDSKSTAGDSVPVRVRSPAPNKRATHVGGSLIWYWSTLESKAAVRPTTSQKYEPQAMDFWLTECVPKRTARGVRSPAVRPTTSQKYEPQAMDFWLTECVPKRTAQGVRSPVSNENRPSLLFRFFSLIFPKIFVFPLYAAGLFVYDER